MGGEEEEGEEEDWLGEEDKGAEEDEVREYSRFSEHCLRRQ